MKIYQVVVVATMYLGVSSADTLRGSTTEFERMLAYDYGSQCANNFVCAELGLEDLCCPTADGQYLDCCNRACDAHSACNSLAENCCPTNDNVELDCCDHAPKLAQYRNADPACSAHAACSHLEGSCCPTADATYLGCCSV